MAATEQEAYDLLDKLKIPYQRVDHPAITSVKNLDFDLPGPQVKNLVLKPRKGDQVYLVILPDEKQADLKLIAAELNEKRLSFVSPERLYELMAVPPGTVTPFALMHDRKHKITVVIDKDVDHNDTVGFHPNINSTTLMIAFQDFITVLNYLDYSPLYIKIDQN